MTFFNEISFRLGQFIQEQTDSELRALTGSIHGSLLGLLALLLGFTFSMSMQRYDNRSQALIDEVNAIGTMSLRSELLAPNTAKSMQTLLNDYTQLRIEASDVALTDSTARRDYIKRTEQMQKLMWDELSAAIQTGEMQPVIAGLLVNALNDVIETQGKRNGLLYLHVPEVVFLLLFLVFVITGGIIGYSGGLSGHRMIAPTLIVSILILLVVFIIIDLDRPRRGMIQISNDLLLDLKPN